MTLYINPMRHPYRRRMMNEMMRDWDEDYSSNVCFPIDVIAEKDSFIIKAVLPGVQADDLDIHIVNEIVTIATQPIDLLTLNMNQKHLRTKQLKFRWNIAF